MTRSVRTLLALATLLVAVSWGLYFDQQKFLDWADEHYDDEPFETFSDNWGSYDWDVHKGECGHFVMRAIAEAAPELAKCLWCRGRFNDNCDVNDATYNDGLPQFHRAKEQLRKLGWTGQKTHWPQMPSNGDLQQIVEPGDILYIYNNNPSGGPAHSGIIMDEGPEHVGWGDHNGINKDGKFEALDAIRLKFDPAYGVEVDCPRFAGHFL